MSIPFPSDAWIKALKEVLNGDSDYARIAANWEGDIVFNVGPGGAATKPLYLYMDLWHGKCRNAYEMTDPSQKKAAFVLSATLPVFTRIIQGQLDAMQAMMTGQLKVAGSMVYMMKSVPTVLRFVKCATLVDTEFADS
mgnify:FL=1